jgi:phosphatidylinositol 3-kinase
LLDSQFSDDDVRAFAVKMLETLSDATLNDYLMQLVQALAFEHRLDSALARFLIRRALNSSVIAHAFFWAIKVSSLVFHYLALQTDLHFNLGGNGQN